ncbi:MAG: hypothetical protein LBL52_02770 [Rickettsiales bacterium]|nr:hypothetical protein [Rickettsiales bacterium]
MAEKNPNSYGWARFILAMVAIVFTIALFGAGAWTVYQILSAGWTVSVYSDIYDAISRAAGDVFSDFQGYAIAVLSMGLALWMVHETYKTLYKGMGMGESTMDAKYFEGIYKKLFLTTAIIGLFLINTPRNVFSNTFEIILNLGSGVGRELLQRKIVRLGAKIPEGCEDMPGELSYETARDVLSKNTKLEMTCMMREAGVLREDYIKLGGLMFDKGKGPLVGAIVSYITIRFGAEIVGSVLTFSGNSAGRIVSAAGAPGAAVVAGAQVLLSREVQMGITGVVLVGGFFFINLLFAFIFIENLLLMGAGIILFPLLIACYVFEETRSYAVAALSELRKFAIGLIFICIALVICSEANDWILGGMFGAAPGENITRTRAAIKLLEVNDLDGFERLIKFSAGGTAMYILWAIFAVALNAKILGEASKFAGWFDGAISESGLGKSLYGFGKSVKNSFTSINRELYGFAKNDERSGLTKLKNNVMDVVRKRKKAE